MTIEISLKEVGNRVNEILNILDRKGVILYPTDTVEGLGAYAGSTKGLERINLIKGRVVTKPVSYIFRDLDMIKEYCIVSNFTEQLIEEFLPGALTIILPVKENQKLEGINKKTFTVGIRMIELKGLEHLLRRIKRPLITTSANISGYKPIGEYEKIPREIIEKVDLAISWKGKLANKPSTIIDLSLRNPNILREGQISAENLFQFIRTIE